MTVFHLVHLAFTPERNPQTTYIVTDATVGFKLIMFLPKNV